MLDPLGDGEGLIKLLSVIVFPEPPINLVMDEALIQRRETIVFVEVLH